MTIVHPSPLTEAVRITGPQVAREEEVLTQQALQFVTGLEFTNWIQIPGLSANSQLVSVFDRGGFNRPSGTALHPIEFGTALTVLLPLCLHLAFHPGPLGRIRRWLPLVAIAVAVPLSISRSAILGAIVVLAIVMPSWSPRARRSSLFRISCAK